MDISPSERENNIIIQSINGDIFIILTIPPDRRPPEDGLGQRQGMRDEGP